MTLVLAVLGAGLVVFAVADMLKTTLVVDGGGGPATMGLARLMWRTALGRRARTSPERSLARRTYAILLAMVAVWVLALWCGWALVFAAGERAVLDTQTLEPAPFWARVYYAGFALITLGVGDYRPGAAPWQLLSVVAAITGFFVLTLTITYLAPVLSAIVDKRSLAASIVDLGATPDDLLRRAWHAGGLDALEPSLRPIVASLRTHQQRHLAYPILFFTTSTERRGADAVAIAALDEALAVVEHGLTPDARPTSPTWHSVRRALDAFVDMHAGVALTPHAVPPPAPPLEELREAGLPVVSNEAFERALCGRADHRRHLATLVREAGWTWDTLRRGAR